MSNIKPVFGFLRLIQFFVVTPILCLWTVVEFLIYLFKDLPFNWWSFGLLVTNVTWMSILLLIDIYKDLDNKRKALQKTLDEPSTKKSTFQTRLEDAMKVAEEQKLKDIENTDPSDVGPCPGLERNSDFYWRCQE